MNETEGYVTHFISPTMTQPVARCTAFAATVAIGALGMSAPAAASPVSTTADSTVTAAGITGYPLGETLFDDDAVVLAEAAAEADPEAHKALTEATDTLVHARQLTDEVSVRAERADRIEQAANEIRTLVAEARTTDDAAAKADDAAAALADRTDRASRGADRSEIPASTDRAADAATATTGDLTEATESLAALLRNPEKKKAIADESEKKQEQSDDDAPADDKDSSNGSGKKEHESKKSGNGRIKSGSSRGSGRSGSNGNSSGKISSGPNIERGPIKDLSGAAVQYGNGQLPSDLLCDITFSSDVLRCDAAVAAERLNAAFKEAFGRNLQVNDAYRSYEDQVTVKANLGALAAPPGTSNHGWGQALDLGDGIETFDSAEYTWMKANAGAFGWNHPAWAEPTGEKPEAWHWEYGPPIS